MSRFNIVSFWAPRPTHNKHADYYPECLATLQHSCDRAGLRHVILSDAPQHHLAPGAETHVAKLPKPLMQALTAAQASWMEKGDWQGGDTLFCGIDCLFPADPSPALDALGPWDLLVARREPRNGYAINTGIVAVRAAARERATPLFRAVADATDTYWCADMAALQDQLAPIPDFPETVERGGMTVAFVPMFPFNVRPNGLDDPCPGAVMMHFRGKRPLKTMMRPWYDRHVLGIAPDSEP